MITYRQYTTPFLTEAMKDQLSKYFDVVYTDPTGRDITVGTVSYDEMEISLTKFLDDGVDQYRNYTLMLPYKSEPTATEQYSALKMAREMIITDYQKGGVYLSHQDVRCLDLLLTAFDMEDYNDLPIVQLEKDERIIVKIYKSVHQALKEFDAADHQSNISNCIYGRASDALGFKWEYYDPQLHGEIQ